MRFIGKSPIFIMISLPYLEIYTKLSCVTYASFGDEGVTYYNVSVIDDTADIPYH